MLIGKSISFFKNNDINNFQKEDIDYILHTFERIKMSVKFQVIDISTLDKIKKTLIDISRNRNHRFSIPKLSFDKSYFEIISFDKKHYGILIEYLDGKCCVNTFSEKEIQYTYSSDVFKVLTPTNLIFLENDQGIFSAS